MANPSPAEIARLARGLEEAGFLNLDQSIRELTSTPALATDTAEVEPDWEALFGSSYVLVRAKDQQTV
jgi:hypothetical protein